MTATHPDSFKTSDCATVGFFVTEKDLLLMREGCEEYHFALSCRAQEKAGGNISHCIDHACSEFDGNLQESIDELRIVRKLMTQVQDREYVRKRDKIEENAVSVVHLSPRSAETLRRALLTHHSAVPKSQNTSPYYWRCLHLPTVLARLQELTLPLMVAAADETS